MDPSPLVLSPDFHWHGAVLPREGLHHLVHQAIRRPKGVFYARTLWPAVRVVGGDHHDQGANQCPLRDPLLHRVGRSGLLIAIHLLLLLLLLFTLWLSTPLESGALPEDH